MMTVAGCHDEPIKCVALVNCPSVTLSGGLLSLSLLLPYTIQYSPVCSKDKVSWHFCFTYTCLFDLTNQQQVHTTQTHSTFYICDSETLDPAPHKQNPLHTHDNMSSRGRGAGKFKAKRGGKHDNRFANQQK